MLVPSRVRLTIPAAWSACRCCEVLALDCPVARASSSTVRGAWARRSRISSRRGLAKAFPIAAIASKSASLASAGPIRLLLKRSIDTLSSDGNFAMYFRQLLNDETACASYLLGCKTHSAFAVVDSHEDLVDDYIRLAAAQGAEIEAVLDTHVQADHVTDRRRADEPWLVLTGDALLVGDAGRPDLHAHGDRTPDEMARILYRSLTERLLALPDELVLYPSHYPGSVCGRGLSANPVSTIAFERRHNPALQFASETAFVEALLRDVPPPPEQQAAIVAANPSG